MPGYRTITYNFDAGNKCITIDPNKLSDRTIKDVDYAGVEFVNAAGFEMGVKIDPPNNLVFEDKIGVRDFKVAKSGGSQKFEFDKNLAANVEPNEEIKLVWMVTIKGVSKLCDSTSGGVHLVIEGT